jgi:FdrA protein
MQISSALTASSGVRQALVAMATPVNLALLSDMDFETPVDASPNDLVVAFVAEDDESLAAALDQLERELTGPATPTARTPGSPDVAVAPRTTATAARTAGTGLALVSTPGPYAFVEAMDALDAGLSVLVFSDNVPVEHEVRLKRYAADRGLLVMGPDCGTAVVGGVGLGFANVVRPGPVGLVAASGTGAQQMMCLLAAAGVGISHCLGVGGRDLSGDVGGAATHAAMDALDADPDTRLIVVLSKPPAVEVAEEVRAHAAKLSTPVLVAPLGPHAPDLTVVAEDVLAHLAVPVPEWPTWEPSQPLAPPGDGGWLRGLFSGGTLCVEALVVAASVLGPVRSNIPLRPEWTVGTVAEGHTMLDLGADEYTLGRPHPMLDPGPRVGMLEREAADPRTAVLLLDVVLGHGAHPDPAAELAPAIRSALRRPEPLSVVVSLVGTPEDPQGLTDQASALRSAGAWVYLSNAAAARHAARLARGITLAASP